MESNVHVNVHVAFVSTCIYLYFRRALYVLTFTVRCPQHYTSTFTIAASEIIPERVQRKLAILDIHYESCRKNSLHEHSIFGFLALEF